MPADGRRDLIQRLKGKSLTLKVKYRLRVFKNRVPRKIFGPKKDEVTGVWRKLRNEEIICTPHQIMFG